MGRSHCTLGLSSTRVQGRIGDCNQLCDCSEQQSADERRLYPLSRMACVLVPGLMCHEELSLQLV